MNEHEATGSDVGSARPTDRVDEFMTGVYALHVPNQTERLERRLYRASIVLPIIGFIVIWIGWWGASGTKYVYQQTPYVISGGLFGLALVLIGAALFARYSVARLLRFWLARLLADQQIQTGRLVDAITTLAEAINAQSAVTDEVARRQDARRHGR